MSLNIEQMLFELLRFDRKTSDKVKVDKMVYVVARMIGSEITQNEYRGRYGSMLEDMDDNHEGHA